MIGTSISQSTRLINCGVSTDTADMCRSGWELIAHPYTGMLKQWIGSARMKGYEVGAEDFDLSPAWSLNGLMTNVLPKCLNDEFEEFLTLSYDSYNDGGWRCGYIDTCYTTYADTPIEACIKMYEMLYNEELI